MTKAQPEGYLRKARRLVQEQYNSKTDPTTLLHINDVYVVWFSKTLKNWKALVSTEKVDGLYYEVTYNGDKKETYVDVYAKISNTVYPD